MNNDQIIQESIVDLEHSPRTTQLGLLDGFDVDILIDDSESMNDIDRKKNRWNEAKKIVKSINKLLTNNDEREHKNTIHFLNQSCVTNLRCTEQINQIFKTKPNGCSSITNKLQSIMDFKIPYKRLIIIITDGYVTNNHHMIDIIKLQQLISGNKNLHDYILLFCLTNEKNIHICFDKWTTYYENFYYVADYKAEKKNNKGKEFSHDDYVENAIYNCINSVPKHIDQEGCCVIL